MFASMMEMTDPSKDYGQLMTSLKGKSFQDPDFCPNNRSLFGSGNSGNDKPEWQDIVWLQPH